MQLKDPKKKVKQKKNVPSSSMEGMLEILRGPGSNIKTVGSILSIQFSPTHYRVT